MATDGKGIVKVPGVLRTNEETRQELLNRLFWEDKTYTDFGNEFVRYSEFETRQGNSLTDGLMLYDFTHGETDFAKDINRMFVPKNVSERKYVVRTDRKYDGKKWEGDYFETFTKDNKLDEIGNIEFTKGRAINEYNRMDRRMETKYITPALINFYGSSAGMLPLTSRFAIVNSTGRMSDIPEANVSFVHDFWDSRYNDDDFGQKKYLVSMAQEAEKVSPVSSRTNHFLYDGSNYFSSYINFSRKEGEGRGVLTKLANNPSDGNEFEDKTGDFWTEQNRVKIDWSTRFYFDEGDVSHEGENERRLRGRETLKGEKNNLLHKTNRLFNEHKISTLVGRFHTSSEIPKEASEFDSAKTDIYGNSHGRNLLKKSHRGKKTNGYENPYCRVWTYHHQYDSNEKLIRPFITDDGGSIGIQDLHSGNPYKVGDGNIGGSAALARRTVLGSNGYVNIAPSNRGTNKVDIKNCMFSIENLAWKDVAHKERSITNEQIGPNGGRIMWFPPYDLDFQENINVEWNSSKFLGRGESVWTYSNTERNGTLSFALLIDHPSIIDNIPKYIPKADNGNSASETGDLEWDVLRFFAGCDPLTFDINKDSSEEELEQKMPSEEPAQTLPEKANKIKFYVFFPNNYSGHYNGGKGNINDAAPDADWYEYLIAGKDISVPEVGSKNEYIGYEIGNKGVTTDMSTGYSEETKIQSVSSTTIGFGYRVDGDLRQLLRNNFDGDTSRPRPAEQTNYNDRVSFKLNKTKYEKGGATDSFYDVYTALAEAFPSAYNGRNYGVLNDDSRKLAKIFSNRKFTKIEIKGCATKQDDKNSVKLANRRAISIKTMLKKSGIDFGDIDLDDNSIFGIETEELKDMSDVNSLESKANRRASVTLYYDGPEIKTLGRIEPVSNANLIHPRIVQETETVLQRDESGRTYFKEVQKKKDTNVVPERMVALKTISTTDKAARYETEAEYFHKLEERDPLIYRNIVDKFKYFDPAFHSISPEGFNARLTFLHQCTRQGHTIETSSLSSSNSTGSQNGKNAGNLAFGRMPVCVLRIGDFINTKIIIRSISINYGSGGPMRFDLNPEGIGVQPMYAKISMAITILGGQSLEGPINRLQNAVSFNYYSNTEVYDDRSDIRSSASGSKIKYDRIFVPDMQDYSGTGSEASTTSKPSESSGTSS